MEGFSLLLWAAWLLVGCLVLFVEARGRYRRAKGLRVGSTGGTEGCQGQGGGFWAVLGQVGGFFRGFSGLFFLGSGCQGLPYCSRLLSGLWDVLCSFWRQGGADRRPLDANDNIMSTPASGSTTEDTISAPS